MKQRKSQLLRLHLEPPQVLLNLAQMEKMEADSRGLRKHLRGDQMGDQTGAGWVESAGEVHMHKKLPKMSHFLSFMEKVTF